MRSAPASARTGVDDVVIPAGSDLTRIRAEVAGVGPVEVVLERTLVAVAEPLTCHGPGEQEIPHYRAVELIEVDGQA